MNADISVPEDVHMLAANKWDAQGKSQGASTGSRPDVGPQTHPGASIGGLSGLLAIGGVRALKTGHLVSHSPTADGRQLRWLRVHSSQSAQL